MSDPLTLGLASTAVGLVNSTIGLLKQARESAKQSEDHELKDRLNEVYDAVLGIKDVIGNLRDENDNLRNQLDTRANLKWDSKSKLYFMENDRDPFCPACMGLDRKAIRLRPGIYKESGRQWGYVCKVCSCTFDTTKLGL
jgi:hypothetical protein